MKTIKPVTQMYLGNKLGNGQDPDPPGEQDYTMDATKISGRGSTSGGSKPTHQAKRPRSGAVSGSSRPKSAQRLRG